MSTRSLTRPESRMSTRSLTRPESRMSARSLTRPESRMSTRSLTRPESKSSTRSQNKLESRTCDQTIRPASRLSDRPVDDNRPSSRLRSAESNTSLEQRAKRSLSANSTKSVVKHDETETETFPVIIGDHHPSVRPDSAKLSSDRKEHGRHTNGVNEKSLLTTENDDGRSFEIH